jgi:hypothetical protein
MCEAATPICASGIARGRAMANPSRKLAFVTAATDHGTFIVNVNFSRRR